MFKRSTNIFNNVMNDTFRKRNALSFRKTLGIYNFKCKPNTYFKNPHAVPFKTKMALLKKGDNESWKKIKNIERFSNRPFGTFTSKGIFKMDYKRIPNYTIPDVRLFNLLPYVAFNAKEIPDNKVSYQKFTKEYLCETIQPQLKNSKNANIRKLAKEIFDSKNGLIIAEEFFANFNKKSKIIKVTNF